MSFLDEYDKLKGSLQDKAYVFHYKNFLSYVSQALVFQGFTESQPFP